MRAGTMGIAAQVRYRPSMAERRTIASQIIRLGGDPVALPPRAQAQEHPIAFEVNGLGYAVMLASPHDLMDYATGFAASEGLICTAADLLDCTISKVDGGTVIRLTVPDSRAAPLRERLRLRLVEGSCGLCGIDSLAEVLRPLPVIAAVPNFGATAIARALAELPGHQPISRATGGVHAAAFCDAEGAIVAAREDVGRHNALDKLNGHLLRNKIDPAGGFMLLSARCSAELVEKTARAGCPALVTISVASDLALDRARQCGLTLVTRARADSALATHDPHGLFAGT